MTQPTWKTELGVVFQPLNLQASNAAGEGGDAGGPPYEVPAWIPLVPAPNGSLLKGNDGRVFEMEDAQAVIDATRMPIALDWNHASIYGPFSAQPGKAAARILEIELRDDETMWGRCEWTTAGRASVEAGEYLYISPTFRIRYDYDSEGPPEVLYLMGAGLVNNPNFTQLPALNREEPPYMKPAQSTPTGTAEPEGTAAPVADPAAAPEAAGDTDLAAMQQELAELRRERQEREQTRENEVAALRQELATERQAREADRKARHEEAVNAALDKAIADRRIAPSTREYFATQCRLEGGLEAFNAFVASQPQMLADTGLDNADPAAGEGGEITLTAQEREVAANMGIKPEDYLETKKANAAKQATGQPPGL